MFSQFTSFLRRVRDRLDAEGITSQLPRRRTRKRADVIGALQAAATTPVFLISLKAGGFGLTLTEADYVFVLDPWWNPAVEAQAVDRTHRIGQDRPVIVYRLVAAGTIEEKVMELKARKADLVRPGDRRRTERWARRSTPTTSARSSRTEPAQIPAAASSDFSSVSRWVRSRCSFGTVRRQPTSPKFIRPS